MKRFSPLTMLFVSSSIMFCNIQLNYTQFVIRLVNYKLYVKQIMQWELLFSSKTAYLKTKNKLNLRFGEPFAYGF